MPSAWTDCARLNLRVLRLLLAGRWTGRAHLAEGYDRVAPVYDRNWLVHLRGVTDDVLAHLPEQQPRRILDLGCGTGYTTEALARRYPAAEVVGTDLSAGMLAEARRRLEAGADRDGGRVRFEASDMLDFLRRQPGGSVDLIVSAWALGYSRPRAVIAESARTLTPGGVFAFVVNLADTLEAVQRAFRVCMARHADRLALLAWPRFPRGPAPLGRAFRRAGLRVLWQRTGEHEVHAAPRDDECLLPWLLGTGALAGFDAMLPLATDTEVAATFEAELRRQRRPIVHRFTAAVARLG